MAVWPLQHFSDSLILDVSSLGPGWWTPPCMIAYVWRLDVGCDLHCTLPRTLHRGWLSVPTGRQRHFYAWKCSLCFTHISPRTSYQWVTVRLSCLRGLGKWKGMARGKSALKVTFLLPICILQTQSQRLCKPLLFQPNTRVSMAPETRAPAGPFVSGLFRGVKLERGHMFIRVS